MILRGRIWKVGDNMKSGGDIVPTEYDYLGSNFKYDELSKHVFEKVLPHFASRVCKGDLVVAGNNFGAGHAHFHIQAIKALAAAGMAACVTESYAGAFQRMAINTGFPALEAKGIRTAVETGDELELNLLTGEVKNITRGSVIRMKPVPQTIIDILESGGLESYAVRKLGGGPGR